MEAPAVQQEAPASPLPGQQAPAPGRVARWLPLLLAAFVGCGTVGAFVAPSSDSFFTRDASLSVFFADIDRGLVHEVYSDPEHADQVVWRPDGSWMWSSAPAQGYGRAGVRIRGIRSVLAEAAAVNRDADIADRGIDSRWNHVKSLGTAAGFGAFLLLIGGPQPRRANRWAWFWIFYVGRLAGLGVLAFLLLGAGPGRKEARHRPRGAEARRRIDGWQGFAIALVVGLALSILAGVLQPYVAPDRSGRTAYTYDQSAGPQ
jgi:hypothetical protein